MARKKVTKKVTKKRVVKSKKRKVDRSKVISSRERVELHERLDAILDGEGAIMLDDTEYTAFIVRNTNRISILANTLKGLEMTPAQGVEAMVQLTIRGDFFNN